MTGWLTFDGAERRGICFWILERNRGGKSRFVAALGMTDTEHFIRSRMRTYYVYMIASKSRALYIGVTRDLTRRISEHKQKLVPGFTARYNMDRLCITKTSAAFVQRSRAKKRSRRGDVRRRLLWSSRETQYGGTWAVGASEEQIPRDARDDRGRDWRSRWQGGRCTRDGRVTGGRSSTRCAGPHTTDMGSVPPSPVIPRSGATRNLLFWRLQRKSKGKQIPRYARNDREW